MLYRFRRTSRLIVTLTKLPKLFFSASNQKKYKVAVLGASGGIGQPLSLLLKMNSRVSQLKLFDIAKVTPGVAKDLSHINSPSRCKGYVGDKILAKCLEGAEIVVIPAGMPRKPGMTRDDLFNKNASIVYNLTCAVVNHCPNAIICVITNPVNSMVPIVSEIMMMSGVYDGAKILGVTTLDLVRASTFVSRINGSDPRCQQVPVVGGHAGATIVPLLSRSLPPVSISDGDRDKLTKKIQEAGTEVVKAKAGGGSATLSMAFAAARFTDAVMRGLSGEPNVVECAYVGSCLTKASYFASPIRFGCKGMEINLGLGKVSCYEQTLIDKAVPILQKNIQTGKDFAKKAANHAD